MPGKKARCSSAAMLEAKGQCLVDSHGQPGQPYTTSGWNTNLRWLMEHARKKAEKEGIEFQRFTLKDMRPAAVADRVG